ncbi:sigma 54-interacting transcriptional regulator [Nitrospira sp. Kam-Ns4a]
MAPKEAALGCLKRRQTDDDATTACLEQLGLVGRSPALRLVREFVQKAGQVSDVPVLITGESRTGKELIARAIHQVDRKRSQGPFVAVNCSAVPGSLAESEFFGHARGAFTGAIAAHPGLFRAAHRGVLFLDEVSELDLRLQPKLLRVLQEGRILAVGETVERAVDVRVIAGTNKELAAAVSRGEFRLDLYHRLNVLSLRVPGLKQRKEDIAPLVQFFLEKYRACYQHGIRAVEPRVLELLTSLELQGNVRELENIVRQALFRKRAGDRLEMGDLPPEVIRLLLASPSADRELALDHAATEMVRAGVGLSEALKRFEPEFRS